jgi:hypothetical protein
MFTCCCQSEVLACHWFRHSIPNWTCHGNIRIRSAVDVPRCSRPRIMPAFCHSSKVQQLGMQHETAWKKSIVLYCIIVYSLRKLVSSILGFALHLQDKSLFDVFCFGICGHMLTKPPREECFDNAFHPIVPRPLKTLQSLSSRNTSCGVATDRIRSSSQSDIRSASWRIAQRCRCFQHCGLATNQPGNVSLQDLYFKDF